MREMVDSGVPWIGVIPKNWRILRGKNILTLLERPVKEDDGVITCFRDGEVTLRSNRREEGFTFSLQEIGYQGIEPGDLVVHGMDGFAGSIGISDSRGKATPVLNVMDSSESKKYLMYQLRTMAHCGLFFALSSGIRVRSCDTNWNKLKTISYLVPPKDEQLRIVSFIDVKCAEIDAILEKTRASIEEYKKLKQSVITEAVTKGIRGDRQMKDSGVEWIGPVPLEWDVCKLKYRITLINGRAYSDSELLSEGKYKILRVGNLFTNEKWYYSDMELAPDKYCEKGDLLYAWSASFGPYIWSGEKVIYHYHIWKAKLNGLERDYAYYTLMAFTAYKKLDAHGTAMVHLTMANMNKSSIPIPTIAEQQEIAAYLDEKCAAIDSLIASKEALITELEAYKKSIIYEYVTGKKQVL